MATQVVGGPGTFQANFAISAYRAVIVSNNGGISYADTNTQPMGFAETDLAAADYGAVRFLYANYGSMKGVISVACTAGDVLYQAANGYLSVLTSDIVTVGKSLTTSGNNPGSLIEFVPMR